MDNKHIKYSVPTVIIADDAPEIRMILQRAIELCDCKVIATAEDGDKAIELIERFKPDMAFIDIEMPKKNGFEVLEAIKERGLNIFSVMVSGHSSKDNLTSAMKCGARAFIVKPHSQKKVEDVVASYLVTLK